MLVHRKQAWFPGPFRNKHSVAQVHRHIVKFMHAANVVD